VLTLPLRARWLVATTVLRAALIWAVPLFALATSPWLLGWGMGSGAVGLDLTTLVRVALAAAVVPCLVAIALIVWFPHARYGDWVVARIGRAGGHPTNRAVNLADQLGLATGTYRHHVMAVGSPVPNVAAIPGREGTTIVVTAGAEHQLPRDDLEALMATQVVVASDRWVQVASAAQLVSAPRFAVLFGAGFLNPFLIPLAFVAFFGHRRGDAVRDMVADSAALRATRHPEALSRSLYELRPAAPHASALRVGLPAFLVDQYWVLSRRAKVTTTVSGPAGSRQWTTTEEIAAEMAMRADRVLRGSRGELAALFDLRSWKRAVKGLGRQDRTPAGLPIPLTPDEHARAAKVAAALD
jgi:Zn-dependent protease with chaperone function